MSNFLDTAFGVWLGMELADMNKSARKQSSQIVRRLPDIVSEIDINLPADEWLKQYSEKLIHRYERAEEIGE